MIRLRCGSCSVPGVPETPTAPLAAEPYRFRYCSDMTTMEPCPRCGGGIPSDERRGEYIGATSRLDNETEICSQCGQDEAMFNFANPGQPLPPLDRPVFERP